MPVFWPGDANNDGVVNVRDLLAIGYGLEPMDLKGIHPTPFGIHTCDEWG